MIEDRELSTDGSLVVSKKANPVLTSFLNGIACKSDSRASISSARALNSVSEDENESSQRRKAFSRSLLPEIYAETASAAVPNDFLNRAPRCHISVDIVSSGIKSNLSSNFRPFHSISQPESDCFTACRPASVPMLFSFSLHVKNAAHLTNCSSRFTTSAGKATPATSSQTSFR